LGEGVGDSAADSNPEVKRRSSRIVQAVPLVVSGVDALGRPFQERTSTLVINCHGCRYQSKHYVLKNMWVTLEVPNPEQGFEPRMARARVMWIQRPRTVRELFQVGVELETPGNFWGIAFPPPDWFAFPEAGDIPAADADESRRLSGDWSTTGPARTVAEDNLRTMPLSGGAEQNSPHSTGAELSSARVAIAEQALARQMAHLVAEAKQQLQEAIRESTAQALSEETPPLLAALQKQVQEVAERSVEAATSNAIRGALEQATQASEAQFQTLREQWNRELDRSVEQASDRAAQRFDDLAWQRNAAFEQQLEGRLQRAMENAEQAAGGFAARLASTRENAERFDQQAGDSASAILQQVEQRIQITADQARRQLADLDDAARQLDERIANANAAAQENWQWRLDADVAAARERWNQQIESAAQNAAERLRSNFQQTSMQLEQEMQDRAAAMGTALAESRAATEGSIETLRTYLANETAQAQETLNQIRSASQGMEDWSARAAEITRSAQQELERRAAAVVEAESRQLASSVEEGIAAWKGRLEPALEMAGRQAIERLGGELERQLDSGLDRASRALEELQRGTSDSQAALRAHQETMAKVSTQEVENAVSRLLESMGRLERDFGEAGRVATAKWLAELENKATETTHATFESMFKTAEWYEKKVHNQMQETMSKGLEQAGGQLREKAGEISGLFATELDHYSRSYVEHAQGQLEEAARDTLENVGKQCAELTTASAASFAQQTLNQTDATLAELRNQSGAIVEQLSAQMQARAEQVRKASDANLFKSAREFQAGVTQEKEQALDSAKQDLATQTAFARETLRLAGENLEKRLRQTAISLSDESMEEYKKRLENASNSWLLATVTNLNQQSEQHIENLAQSTEARLRETCNEVFGGLGETLRRRMLDLFGPSAGESGSPESK